jgi:outer membrane protein assembly factor BamB
MNRAFLPICALIALLAASRADVIESSGLSGGLAVVVGTEAVEQVSLDRLPSTFIVQILADDANEVSALRDKARSFGVHGRVTARKWNGGRLPYGDELVNLLVIANGASVKSAEIDRVLAPGGTTRVGNKEKVKAWPQEIDDWTHFLHSPGNNAVADDRRVGPPRTLRWDCGPRYCRSHELDVSVAAAVVQGGKLFSIVDKGPAGTIGKKTPDKWMLEARDAFNGLLLWERPVPDWSWREWKPELLKLDSWLGLIAQRRLIPATLPRRLVAVDGRIYVTLGVMAPVSVLDAATGKTIHTIAGTEGVDELLLENGHLLMTRRPHLREAALTNPDMDLKRVSGRSPMPVREDGLVIAADAGTGKVLWRAPEKTVIPYTLAAVNGRAFYHTGSELVAVTLKTGKEIWRVANANTDANRWDSRHILVAYKDVVLLAVPKKKCEAFEAETGKLLWSGKGGRGTAFNTTPMDLFVIDDMLWFTSGTQYQGKDIRTGEVKRTIDLPKFFLTPGHHLRCYRAKATTRYILDNKRGIEFMDMQEKNHQKNDWVRGACRYGIIPANGLIYSTPTPCNCYQTVQLMGFNALSDAEPPAPGKPALEKGPAFGKAPGDPPTAADWPTLRGNPAREGSTATATGTSLKRRWSRRLGGKLTQPIAAGGRIYVVSRENCILYALDAETGDELWSLATSAEVDSPPTYWKGRLIFGCRDGWIYCLSAEDGTMAWRFRAAPNERQIVSYGRLESSWPLHGTVLVADGTVYAAAGRNTYLDGGITLYGLNANSGEVRCTRRLSNPAQDSLKPYDAHQMEGAMPDIMVYDGKTLSMQSKTFDSALNPVDKPASRRVYATGGFLDGETWHRNIWLYAPGWTLMNKSASKFPNTGQLLVHDGDRTYGVKYYTRHQGQSMVFYPEEEGYLLFCDRDNQSWDSLLGDYLASKGSGGRKKKGKKTSSRRKGGAATDTSIWQARIPLRTRAILRTADALFIAGVADAVPKKDPLAPFEGRSRGLLQAIAPDTGKKLAEYALDTSPVFDGMIAAGGRVFLSLENGSVECW